MQNATLPSVDPLAKIRKWEPVVVPVLYDTAHGVRSSKRGKVVYRSDTMDAVGIAGPRMHVVKHAEICSLYDELIQRKVVGDVRCGEFDGGGMIWIQGKPQGGSLEIIPGHRLEANLTLCDAYDGSLSLALIETATNIACENTFMRAHRSGKGFKLRHTGKIEERFQECVRAIRASVDNFQKDVETFRSLAKTKVEFSTWKAMLDEFFPLPTENESERENVQETRNRLSQIYEQAPGAMPGTRYGMYQATTYWLTHERGRPANRIESNLIGESARMNRKFLDYMLN